METTIVQLTTRLFDHSASDCIFFIQVTNVPANLLVGTLSSFDELVCHLAKLLAQLFVVKNRQLVFVLEKLQQRVNILGKPELPLPRVAPPPSS